MKKAMPELPQSEGLETLLPITPRAGMFGGGRRGPDALIPNIAARPSPSYPFTPLASALGPNAIANLLMPSPATMPLTIGDWAQAAAKNTLPDAPNIQFSGYNTIKPSAPAATPHYRVPPPEVVAAAQASQRRTGVPASVSIAQWINESGWGKHIPKDSNNFFGIKEYDPAKPGVDQETFEADLKTGKKVKKSQRFRIFASPEESWVAHARILSADPRYAKAMSLTHDPDAFVDAIAGKYAPGNRSYALGIKRTMKGNHLYQYDVLPPGQR